MTVSTSAKVRIRAGWSARWGTASFANLDDGGVPRHPGFAVETAEWLIKTGRPGRNGGTGTDASAPPGASTRATPASKLVYREHRISLECLTNQAELPPAGAHILCGGTINRRGSGSPALIYGLLPT